MALDKEDLKDRAKWNKDFLDKKLTSEQAGREDLEAIAIGIGTGLALMHKLGFTGVIPSVGYTFDETLKKYGEALRFYKISDISFD